MLHLMTCCKLYARHVGPRPKYIFYEDRKNNYRNILNMKDWTGLTENEQLVRSAQDRKLCRITTAHLHE